MVKKLATVAKKPVKKSSLLIKAENHESLQRMASIIQDSNDAITLQDLEGNLLAWNRGAEMMYGYTQSEALKYNVTILVPDENREMALSFLNDLKRGIKIDSLETQRKTKDGRVLDVWLTTTKITDEKGQLTGVATTERDITERKQAEAALREKTRELEYIRQGQMVLQDKLRGEQNIALLGQRMLSHLAQFLNCQLGAFYWVSNPNELTRVSGYAYSKIKSTEKIIEFGEGLVGQAALEKKTIVIEKVPQGYFSVNSDLGEAAPRSLLIMPVLYDGRVTGVIELASFEIFSEHQRVFLDHVSENIGIAINTSISREKLQDLLQKTQILGEERQTQQEALEVANKELEEQSRALKDSKRRMESQQAELEQTNLQLEEQALELEKQKATLNQKNNALTEAQFLLNERSDEVERASRYKTEFLANMSHELRTPLNSSLILSRLLGDNVKGNLTSEQVQFANSIYSAGNDLLNLINDILDLSKVEAGKLEIRPEKVHPARVLEGLKRTFGPLAAQKGITFKVSSSRDVPNTILTDPQRLEQILKNLLSNAFKFTENGVVEISAAHQSNGRITISVTDTGIGVSKEQQEIIFEAFRQADGTTNRKYGGTGLGLSISRDLARLLGGSIEVKSQAGEGSCFTLTLPEVYNEFQVEAAQPKSYSVAKELVQSVVKNEKVVETYFDDDRKNLSQNDKIILVVEDDSVFAQILYNLAHELNFKCIVAQRGEEGFQMTKDYLPHAILLDIKLPDQSGLIVLDRLKAESSTRHIPVHIVSGEENSEVAMNMGAIGFMQKPVHLDQLKVAFRRLELKMSQKIKKILFIEDENLQLESMMKLISADGVEVTAVKNGQGALAALKLEVFDCMVMDLKMTDMTGDELLQKMLDENIQSCPPVIIYTEGALSRDDEFKLRKYSRSIVIKGARSPERLMDEVTLFLHSVEPKQVNRSGRSSAEVLMGKKILLVDDDVRNIFALSGALQQKGAIVTIARNGREALEKLANEPDIDLVLMDIMMPEMDGYEAMREIRKIKKLSGLPIIAVTARAMIDDQERCIAAGANDYLSKPIDLNTLYSMIKVWMPRLRIL